jgi:hypothetical protein
MLQSIHHPGLACSFFEVHAHEPFLPGTTGQWKGNGERDCLSFDRHHCRCCNGRHACAMLEAKFTRRHDFKRWEQVINRVA